MRVLFLVFLIGFLNLNFVLSQDDLAVWTFETSIPTSSGPHAAEIGTGTASASISGATFSNPSGNGSTESFSANTWGNGKYFQFQTSTTNYQNIMINWEQTRSGSGPASFKVSYSTNGSSFTDLNNYSVNAVTWNTSTYSSGSNFSGNLPATVNNSATLFIRLICLENPTSGGTNRVDDFTISGTQIPMPVEFSKFKTYCSDNSSILSFSTASETNNDYFTIERSGDGRNFDAIGEIKGAGNSTEEKHYEFTDENPMPGINYYRIKQTDFDGQYSYSEIRSVRHTGKGNVAISPRSTDGILDISTEMESYDVAVYSSAGQEVARFNALAGHQTVNIEALQAGIYFVKVMSGTESETVRVVKY